LQYLEIPILMRINTGSSNRNSISPYGLIGPVFDVNLKAKQGNLDVKSNYESLDIGVLGGIGIEISRALVEVRYNKGLRNVLKGGGGNATEGSDYTDLTNTLVTFTAGQTAATVTVISIDDTSLEGTETFTISATGEASQVVTTDTGTGTIYENDLPPSQVLDGAIVTNTNNVGQAGILTFVQSSYVLNAYAQYMLFTQQGNSQSFFADVGWNIDASRNYEVGFEHAGGDATNIGIKSFQIEGAQLYSNTSKVNDTVDAVFGTNNTGNDPSGITAEITKTASSPDEGTVVGGANNVSESIDGSTGNNSKSGGTGFDMITGGPGNDTLVGGSGNDILNGGPTDGSATHGADTLLGNGGNDILVHDINNAYEDGGINSASVENGGGDILRLDEGARLIAKDWLDDGLINNSVTYTEGGSAGHPIVDLHSYLATHDIDRVEILLITDDPLPETDALKDVVGTKLVLDAFDVLDITSTDTAVNGAGHDGIYTSDATLYILGNTGDQVDLGSGWTKSVSNWTDPTDTNNSFWEFTKSVDGDNNAGTANIIVTVRIEDDIALENITYV